MEFFCFNTFGTEIALQLLYKLKRFKNEKDTYHSITFFDCKF
jgi:hypothetical protein